jgi:hypothetical protein
VKRIKLKKVPMKNPPRPQYGSDHQRLRELVLDRNPICQHCDKAFSVHAHHLRYPATSTADYRAVCRACHDEIHKEE